MSSQTQSCGDCGRDLGTGEDCMSCQMFSDYEDAMEDYVHAETIPENEDEAECHNCGHDFDSDEWEVRHLTHGSAAGETWKYTCPGCGHETMECGI